MHIALTGGGTGGHIYPCLALAEYIKENYPEIKLSYIGVTGKLEETLVKDKHPYINFLPIHAYSPSKAGKNPFKMLKWFWDFAIATNTTQGYIKGQKIDAVFGTGGYAAGPAFAAAILSNTKYVIHNLDACMGLANKVFVRDASALTLAFPFQSIAPRNGRVLVTGNPISNKFFEGNGSKAKDTINILITGGSQGSANLNKIIAEILPELAQRSKVKITQVTGTKLYDEFVDKYLDGNKNKYPNFEVLAYTHDMHKYCEEADIAICRAGAMTVAEMAASKTVPIFIPLPWAAHDHQSKNSEALVKANAAFMIKEDDLSKDILLNKIYQLISDETKLSQMQANLSEFTRPDAVKQLASLVLNET